jgi:hypothetical protein
LLASVYVLTRFLDTWYFDVWRELSAAHLLSWLIAILCGVAGGWIGMRLTQKRWNNVIWLIPFLLVPIGMAAVQWTSDEYSQRGEKALSDSATLRWWQEEDGTTVRLVTFDLSGAQPHFDVYDTDFDDAQPLDDRNTTWLGLRLQRVVQNINARESSQNREVLCVVNGSFFGAHPGYVAFHEAPIVSNSKPFYNSRVLKTNWPQQSWTFGVRRMNNKPQFILQDDVPWSQLSQFECALAGVRPLIVKNHSLELKPGMGGTTMKCSRTSVAWSEGKFYILSVHDPDAEMSSLAQKQNKLPQVGGWDVPQVQKFWRELQVQNAVLFDGRESTQIATRDASGKMHFTQTGYQLKKTVGFFNNKPLRVCVPMLPASQNYGGVLNYFYVSTSRTKSSK